MKKGRSFLSSKIPSLSSTNYERRQLRMSPLRPTTPPILYGLMTAAYIAMQHPCENPAINTFSNDPSFFPSYAITY
jgi:hypothetical protein